MKAGEDPPKAYLKNPDTSLKREGYHFVDSCNHNGMAKVSGSLLSFHHVHNLSTLIFRPQGPFGALRKYRMRPKLLTTMLLPAVLPDCMLPQLSLLLPQLICCTSEVKGIYEGA